jgi:hypothetical protein
MDKPLASCKGQCGRCVPPGSSHACVREANEKVVCAIAAMSCMQEEIWVYDAAETQPR